MLEPTPLGAHVIAWRTKQRELIADDNSHGAAWDELNKWGESEYDRLLKEKRESYPV